MPPALCLSPAILDHTFPRDRATLLRVGEALGNLQNEAVDKRLCLLLTPAMTRYVVDFQWEGVTSYPLLLTVYNLLVQWLLQPSSDVKTISVEAENDFIPHPIPEGTGEGLLIDLWREEIGKLFSIHSKCSCEGFCVAIACDIAFSGGRLGSYRAPIPREYFPLVGPNELATIEDFEEWDLPVDLHQRLVSFSDAKKNLAVIGGNVSEKAVGSHFKVTFPGARSWPLDYNVDPIPDRFLEQLSPLTNLPTAVVKYALIFGELPKKKPRF